VANFSATDLRNFIIDDWANFTLTVEEYLTKNSTFSPIYLKSNNILFSEMIKLFVTNEKKIHRFWIVDENEKPVGIISKTDIIKFMRDYNINSN
jgi:predicted transcriptional regulator